MIATLVGFAIALGATAWVLQPIFRGASPAAAPRACPTCGPRPERDARYCSTCGAALPR